MKNKTIKEVLFYSCLIFMMVVSLSLAIKDCTGMDTTYTKIVLAALLADAAAAVTVIYPLTVPAVLLPAIGWITFRLYTDPGRLRLYCQEIKEFLSWLYGYVTGYNYFEPDYSLAFAILFTAFSAFLITAAVYSGRGSLGLILAGTAALAYFWFIYVEKARWYLALYLFAALMLYSYRIYKKRFLLWKASDSEIEHDVGRNWMFCSAAVILISLGISAALPLNIEPVRWTWLNDKAVSLFPFISEWRNDSQESFSYGYNSRFSLNSAGYLDKKLGGELRRDSSVLMKVRVKGEETLYLRGTVRDRYSGNNWYKSKKEHKEYKTGETMPLPFKSDVNTYEKELEITYEKLMTSTVFAPYSIYRVQHSSKKIYADEDSEVYTSKMTMKEGSYSVSSRLPFIDPNKLRQSKAESLEGEYYALYTSIGPEIPERVRALAREITKGQSNNYDKAKAIEKYLRDNYSYTYTPPELPSWSEFTDHFLFEGRKGYCTYFATSMAVLLRALEVPCRYVEGFVSVYDGTENREVRGTDAHAWVEVYFDGFGWVTFEPTPQYPEIEFAVPKGDTGEDISGTAGTAAQISDEGEDGNRSIRRIEEREELVSEESYLPEDKNGLNIGKFLMIVLAALLAARAAYLYCRLAVREINLRHTEGNKFAVAYLDDIVWYLKYAGFEMNKDETLREFLKRLHYHYKERFSYIPDITAILEEVRYGDHEPCPEERMLLEAFRKDVKGFVLDKAGFFKLAARLYIIGR